MIMFSNTTQEKRKVCQQNLLCSFTLCEKEHSRDFKLFSDSAVLSSSLVERASTGEEVNIVGKNVIIYLLSSTLIFLYA